MLDVIRHRADAHHAAINQLMELHEETISHFANRLIDCLMQENKVICCGLGIYGNNARTFVANLVNRFECERPAFPALALTPESALVGPVLVDSPEGMFSRAIQALAQPGDILLTLAGSDHPALQGAIRTAMDQQCKVLVMCDEHGIPCPEDLEPENRLTLPVTDPALVQELQLFVLHCCSDLIDNALFGVHDETSFDL